MSTVRARDIMNRKLVTALDTLPVVELTRLLVDNKVTGAPVVDAHGCLVGVVSTSDIVSHHREVGHRVVSEADFYARPDIATRAEMNRLGMHVEDYDEQLVRDIMTPMVIAAASDTPVATLADMMGINRVHRVLIVDDDEPVGMVSALDLLGLIPGGVHGLQREILWATDLGPDAEVVGRHAIRMARDIGGRLLAVHVTPSLESLLAAYGHRRELPALQKGFEETALARLEELRSKLEEETIEFEILGRSGDPGDVLLELARDRRPSFLVIGAQRPHEARLPGLGSVAERLLASVPVPVLTVPRSA